jgi:tol-pal system protein YbgF
MIKRTIALSLSLALGAAVNAAPAPVTDLSDASIEQRLTIVERMVSSRANSQHRIQEQLDTMQDEVNELRGSIELHNHQLEKILERQRELYLEIDKRIEAVSSQAPVVATAPGQVQSENTYVLSEDENQAYDKAVNLILKDKQYDLAIPQFQAFITKFPNSSYAPNAHYWLGQLLFNKQDWSGAGEQFQVLISGYPDSTKRADAIFKLGVVEQKRSNLARAKQLFEQVISEYPDSSSKKLAETRLSNLN